MNEESCDGPHQQLSVVLHFAFACNKFAISHRYEMFLVNSDNCASKKPSLWATATTPSTSSSACRIKRASKARTKLAEDTVNPISTTSRRHVRSRRDSGCICVGVCLSNFVSMLMFNCEMQRALFRVPTPRPPVLKHSQLHKLHGKSNLPGANVPCKALKGRRKITFGQACLKSKCLLCRSVSSVKAMMPWPAFQLQRHSHQSHRDTSKNGRLSRLSRPGLPLLRLDPTRFNQEAMLRCQGH